MGLFRHAGLDSELNGENMVGHGVLLLSSEWGVQLPSAGVV